MCPSLHGFQQYKLYIKFARCLNSHFTGDNKGEPTCSYFASGFIHQPVYSCLKLQPLTTSCREPLFTEGVIIPRARVMQFLVVRTFLFPPPKLHETGTIQSTGIGLQCMQQWIQSLQVQALCSNGEYASINAPLLHLPVFSYISHWQND